MSSQEKTPQKSPVEKTPHPILGLVEKTPNPIFRLVEKTPHPIFRLVEKTPQLYTKPSFWNFDIFYLNCIQTLTPPLYEKPSYRNFYVFIQLVFQPLSLFSMLVEETPSLFNHIFLFNYYSNPPTLYSIYMRSRVIINMG